ncbi:MAG: hypothetical protein J6J79_03215 [Lachnospiraceae bacterium]|nr:hypothetical protein [Lachnospiraceae bacterium]
MAIENENLYRQERIRKYREIFEPLFRYIPWLTEKQGINTSYQYQDAEMAENTMPIKVYDSTLLAFVKEMQATELMTRNYIYAFSRCRLKTVQDELAWIDRSELENIEDIFDIMAKYVLGGMTKGLLWTQAVEDGVFLKALLRIKELLYVWDGPLA